MSIGDVNSNERGSGARYNDGKTRLEYIPARILLEVTQSSLDDEAQDDIGVAESVLYELANFEESEDASHLIEAMSWLDWHQTCEVFHYGAKKYAAWNWAKGMKWSVPLACAKRHLMSVLHGETIDPESGLPHLGHVGCNVVMLLHFVRHYLEGNDLPPAECFGGNYVSEHGDGPCIDDFECGGTCSCPKHALPEEPVGYEEEPVVIQAPPSYRPLTSEDYARMRGETK